MYVCDEISQQPLGSNCFFCERFEDLSNNLLYNVFIIANNWFRKAQSQ